MKRRTILKRAGAIGIATTGIGVATVSADDDPCDECTDEEQCCVARDGTRFCWSEDSPCPE